MANKIMKFINEKFGTLRGQYFNGQAWLSAKEICKALDVGRVEKVLARLDADEWCALESTPRGSLNKGNGDGTKKKFFVNEAGFFTLVLTSRKPEAREFKRWVTHEVLPSIRRTGEYRTPWQNKRDAGKVIRRNLTDTVKKFIEYLQEHGELDRASAAWYIIFTNLVSKTLKVSGKRDTLTEDDLEQIGRAEDVVARVIESGMAAGKGHHDIHEAAKRQLAAWVVLDDLSNIFND